MVNVFITGVLVVNVMFYYRLIVSSCVSYNVE